jgi:hypothetical protein
MRPLWNGVSFLAVVNLLAMSLVGLWLWRTGRIDADRLQEIKRMLASPIGSEQEPEAATVSAPAQEPEPIDSLALDRQLSRLEEQELLMRRRLADEQRLLAAQIAGQMEALAAARRDLERAQEALRGSQAEARGQQAAEQFDKVVRHLEALPPGQAKLMLRRLVDEGSMQQAVEYLDAMQPRAAAKVLREFKTEAESALAVELLQRLRGLGGEGQPGPG